MDLGLHVVCTDPRSEWRFAFFSAWFAGIGAAGFLVIDLYGAGVRPIELYVRLAHLLVFVVVGSIVWARRHNPTRRFCTIAVLVMWIPFFPSLWLSEETSALSGVAWQPFVGHKALFFGTAAMFPGSPWVGAALLVGFGVHALALWFYLDLGAPAARMPIDEPWATIAYLGVAWLLYCFRIHHGRIETDLARARAEASTLKVTNDAMLVVHDLMNTPLQVLELALALLRRRHVGDEPILAAAVRSLERLRVLRDRLPASQATNASLDPEALERLQSAAADDEGSSDEG